MTYLRFIATILVVLSAFIALQAQSVPQGENGTSSTAVPGLVSYSGTLKDVNGRVLTSITGVTFLIYKDEQGGAPLWLETQSVTPDKSGHYTVELGSASATGLPAEIFQTGSTRWLAMQVANEPEQPRTLLVAVPYAMKAADAETVGGLPASAFARATSSSGKSATSESVQAPLTTSKTVTTKSPYGTANYLPLWTGTSTIQSSKVFQSTTGSVGIGTATPAATLDVHGTGNFTGPITFAAGQTFPGTGTITGVTAGTALTGGGSSGAITLNVDTTKVMTGVVAGTGLTGGGTGGVQTLNLDTTKVPQLSAANTFTSNQTVNGNVSATNVSATGMTSTTSTTTNLTVNNLLSATNANVIGGELYAASTGSTPVYAVSSSTGASTIIGWASSSTGSTVGIEGFTSSAAANAYGVAGFADSSAGAPVGTYGHANGLFGIGIFGQNGTESGTGVSLLGGTQSGPGAWGDGGTNVGGIGVAGTADEGFGGVFKNSSPSGYATLVTESFSSTSLPFYAENALNSTYCLIDANGNFYCTGSKNAIVPIDSGRRTVALSAIESPKNWFEDFGSGQLVNGVTLVALDADFIQTVNTAREYQVFLTPYGDCKGLYVTHRTPNSFEVHELGGGTDSLSFGYRITALRKNYEKVRFADLTADVSRIQQQLPRTKAHTQLMSHDPVRNTHGQRP